MCSGNKQEMCSVELSGTRRNIFEIIITEKACSEFVI
jgi:hypothetical protein